MVFHFKFNFLLPFTCAVRKRNVMVLKIKAKDQEKNVVMVGAMMLSELKLN